MTINTPSKVIKTFLSVFFTFSVFKEFTTAVAELKPDLYFWNGSHETTRLSIQSIPVCNDLLKRSQFWYAAGKQSFFLVILKVCSIENVEVVPLWHLHTANIKLHPSVILILRPLNVLTHLNESVFNCQTDGLQCAQL